MYLHANAKLGLAGRLALVHAVEEGLSLEAAAAAFSVSPATMHRWWHRWLDGERKPSALWIARAGRGARRGCSQQSCRSGSATAGDRPAGGHRSLPARPASPTRPCGRCSSALGSHGAPERSGSRQTATSGRARATCCTWTSPSTRASCVQDTASPATARSACADAASTRGSGTTSRTRSSTTTPASPTSSSTTTRKQRR